MSYGSTQYDRTAETTTPPRDLEAAAFAFVNQLLENAVENKERITALGRNHRLWSLLLTDVGLSSNALPPILKQDLVTIGSWSMSYSIIAMGRDLPLQALVQINNDMIEALRMKQALPEARPVVSNGDRMKFAVAV